LCVEVGQTIFVQLLIQKLKQMTNFEFSHKVNLHYSPLRGYALKLTQDHEDANDLVQETMLKAFKNKDKFEEGTNLKGWLYTIMKNIFINNYRRMVKGNIFTDDTEGQFYINQASFTDKNEGERNLVMKEINTAIGELADNLKIPFLMSFEGYKYEEIAEQLDVPLGTVKIRIHVARQRLMERLKDYGTKHSFVLE
jgi:RNA polymerase sigma-70 factor (ECF subfamily)